MYNTFLVKKFVFFKRKQKTLNKKYKGKKYIEQRVEGKTLQKSLVTLSFCIK